jgi:hypothetical protein
VRSCLDWTERRPHLAGRLGAVLLDHLVSTRAVIRQPGTRVVKITDEGRTYLTETFGISLRSDAQREEIPPMARDRTEPSRFIGCEATGSAYPVDR